MGTMSRYQSQTFGVTLKQLCRAHLANRQLSGQRLSDVLTVINQRQLFNRKCRRLVFSHWRKHCRKMGWGVASGLKNYKGMGGTNDHPALVQLRLLSHAA